MTAGFLISSGGVENMNKSNWLIWILKAIVAYGIYLIVYGQTTSRLSAFCMSLGIMILLVFAEYAVEQWVERRRERKEKENEE